MELTQDTKVGMAKGALSVGVHDGDEVKASSRYDYEYWLELVRRRARMTASERAIEDVAEYEAAALALTESGRAKGTAERWDASLCAAYQRVLAARMSSRQRDMACDHIFNLESQVYCKHLRHDAAALDELRARLKAVLKRYNVYRR